MLKNQFPLVADGEPIIEFAPKMNLYENEDLITNIHGFYQDKDYQILDNRLDHTVEPFAKANRRQTIDAGRDYAEKARQKARQDLKDKRQERIAKEMSYVKKSTNKIIQSDRDVVKTSPISPKPSVHSSLSGGGLRTNYTEPSVKQVKKRQSEWSHLSDKLRQENYILAEIPVMYKEPGQNSQKKVEPNNYDFLKRSQIYNNQETRLQKEKRIAQELNLKRLEEQN